MNEREKEAFDFFVKKGWSPVAASGIVGNLLNETGRRLDPTIIHDNGTGLGLAGWRDPEPGKGRKTNLMNFAFRAGRPAEDFGTQLEFLDHELRTSEASVGNRLRDAKSPEDAAHIFVDYERPSGWKQGDATGASGYRNRLNDARRLMSEHTGQPDVGPSDYAPTRLITVPEQMAAEAAPGPGIGETIGAAARENSLTAWVLTKPWLMPEDPSFQLDKPRLDVLTKGLPQDTWSAFENARSDAEAQSIRRQLIDQQDRRRTLSEAGITGTLASFAASLGDPIGLAVGVASGGVGNAIMWGSKLSRMQRVAAAAMGGAAINAGLAGAEEGLKPLPEWDAVLYAGAGGAFMGAAFGSLSKMPHMEPEADAIRRLSKATVEEVEAGYGVEPLRPKGASVGAASSGMEHSSIRMDASDYPRLADAQNAPEAALGKVRFDATGAAKRSKNPLTRMLANVLGEDAVGNADKSEVTIYTAMEDGARIARKMDARLATEHEAAYGAWVKEKGYGLRERDEARSVFNEEVSRAVSSVDPSDTFDPHVMKAADATERFFRDYHVMAGDPGAAIGLAGHLRPVAGFGPGMPPVKGYLPRIFDYAKVTDAYARHGLPALTEAVTAAMRRLNPEMAPELLSKVSRGYVRKLRELAYGANIRTHGAMFGDDLEGVRGLLSDLDGLSPEDVENVMAQLTRPDDKASVTRAKHRVMLDENLRLEMPDGSVTSFAELFLERDVQKLTRVYNRQMSGRIGAARMRVGKEVEGENHLLIDGITHDGEFDTLIQKVRAVAAEVGQDRGELESDVRLLTYLYKGLVGTPVHDPNTAMATTGRLLRDYGFVRVMGQVGFAQIAELGNIVASSGVKAALASMPGFRVLTRDALSGKLKHALGAEIEAVWGFGAERLRGAGGWRMTGDAEWGTQAATKPWVGKVERGLGLAKHATMEVSGLNAINTAMHRWSTSSILHWFSQAASRELTIPVQRLRSLGLTDAMAERVFQQMRTYRTLVEGSSFKLDRLNLDKWDDLQAAAHFEQAVDRRARRMVQENSPGMFAPWMSHPVAQVMLQFRTFVIGAHSKQLLHNIHMWDRESLSVFLATTFTAAMGHLAQTMANAPALSKEQLEERLSAKGIALGAFQRTGMSALVPMLIDTVARVTGQGPVFTSRSTGLSASIFGNPTMGLVDDIPNAVSALVQPFAQGRQMSRQEMRAVIRPLIWQNTLPAVTLFGAMSQGRPEFALQPSH